MKGVDLQEDSRGTGHQLTEEEQSNVSCGVASGAKLWHRETMPERCCSCKGAPEIFANTNTMLQAKDFILHRLPESGRQTTVMQPAPPRSTISSGRCKFSL